MVYYLFPFCLIALCLLQIHYKFSEYNDHIVLLCFRRYLSLWFKSFTDSRVRCEWVFQLFPTHSLSLEFVVGFCHEIAKGGDCKVKFNQPSCWLYSVPNLLVIYQLVILYLGENHVRVVSERVWRNAQDCARMQRFAARTRSWLATGKPPTAAHMRSTQGSWRVTPAIALQDKSPRLARPLTRDSDQSRGQAARPPCLGKTDSSHSKHTPLYIDLYTHEM